MDFMDQAKTYVPHFAQSQKVKDLNYQLTWRVMGVRVHGIADFYYLVDESLPGGGDPVTSILLMVLNKLFDDGMVPPARNVDLFLQFDNCGENKNKVLFGVLTCLVTYFWTKRKVKLYVEVNFLIVGHTHEDIDQLFKLIADLIRHKSLMTPRSFISAIEAWGRRPGAAVTQVIYLENVFGFKALIKPSVDKEIKYYKEAQALRFYWDDDFDKCCWAAKKFCTDEYWRPTKEQQGTMGSEWLTAVPSFEAFKPEHVHGGTFSENKDSKILETVKKLGGETGNDRHVASLMTSTCVDEWVAWQESQASRPSRAIEFKCPLPPQAPAEPSDDGDDPDLPPGAHRPDRQFMSHRNWGGGSENYGSEQARRERVVDRMAVIAWPEAAT